MYIILLNKTYKRLIEYRHGMHGFARFIIGEIKAGLSTGNDSMCYVLPKSHQY